MTGRSPEDILADFEFSEDGKKVLRCPAGYEPKNCSYLPSNKTVAVSFLHDQCASCPYRGQCKAKIFKRVAKVMVSANAKQRAETQRFMNADVFQKLSRLRNGVEIISSSLRRNYHLDKLPRGKQQGKFFFGCKVAALNFIKLLTYRRGGGNYALNPVIA